ncbi:MAG: hypothetical protein JWP78_2881 [Mucilaginibacter sp.]|nr:hypothetical protein [Mucilaginibacter sp.]
MYKQPGMNNELFSGPSIIDQPPVKAIAADQLPQEVHRWTNSEGYR